MRRTSDQLVNLGAGPSIRFWVCVAARGEDLPGEGTNDCTKEQSYIEEVSHKGTMSHLGIHLQRLQQKVLSWSLQTPGLNIITNRRRAQRRDLLELVVVDTHEGDLCAAALVELVATGLTAKALEQQLSAEVTEGQREEGLPHLKVKGKQPIRTSVDAPVRSEFGLLILTKLCVVSGTFSKTSTCNSSNVSQEMSVSQPIGFFSL